MRKKRRKKESIRNRPLFFFFFFFSTFLLPLSLFLSLSFLIAHMDSLDEGVVSRLDSLSRKELQQICKQLGLKANGKVFYLPSFSFHLFLSLSLFFQSIKPFTEGTQKERKLYKVFSCVMFAKRSFFIVCRTRP